jgi:class 3 adenylate cyclase/TolB-like protein/Tfp pilus assembly protein PilF
VPLRGSTRRLAAIIFIDVVGYTSMMEYDEQATFTSWTAMRVDLFEPSARRHGARFLKGTGDGLLIEFESGVSALEFALRMQKRLASTESRKKRALPVRMSVHFGDVIVEKDDIYGDGVNIAARLLDFADAGQILISSTVHEQVQHVGKYDAVDLGFLALKNIGRRVRAFKIAGPDGAPTVIASPNRKQPGIAVLPFRTFGSDDKLHYGEGMMLDVVASLAGLKELFVISSASSQAFSDTKLSRAAIAKRLGVRYLVAGQLVQSAETFRISAELSDAETGAVLWTNRYDVAIPNIFCAQDDIAAKIAHSLLPHIHNSELQRALRKPPSSLESYDFLLQAVYRMYRLTEEDSRIAKTLLEEAIAHDPSYSLAYAYLAKWYILHIGEGRSKNIKQDANEALRLASLALEHNPSDPLALAVFGHINSFLFGAYEKALDAFDRALAACPSSAIAWCWSASTYCYLGDGPTAIARATHGMALSPLDPYSYFYMTTLTNAHYTNGTHDEAIMWGYKTMVSGPRFIANLRLLAASLVAAGRMEEAQSVGRRILELNPDFRVNDFVTWYPLKSTDRRQQLAERLLASGLPP